MKIILLVKLLSICFLLNKLQNEIKNKVEALHMKDEIIRQKDIEIANLKGGT